MSKPKAVLVAADFLESKMLQELGEKLGPEIEVKKYLGHGQNHFRINAKDFEPHIDTSDLVIVAMSEDIKAEACAARRAKEMGKPLAIMALGYSSWSRPEFEPVRDYAHLMFVVDEDEAAQAKILFPKTRIIVTGHPEWESFAFPKYTRDEVRAKLGIEPQEKFVLISGEKEMGVNFPLAVCVIEAIRATANPESYRVIFTVHPGHIDYPGKNSGTGLLELYKELEQHEPRVRVRVSCKADPFGIGTPDMVPGADIVIGANSNVQIQAAHLRIPAIAILLRRSFRGRELPEDNKGWWPPCDRGAVEPIFGLSSVRTRLLLEQISNFKGSTMQAAQERAFPLAKKAGEAYEKMKQAILEL